MIDFILQRHDLLRHFGDIAIILAQVQAKLRNGGMTVRLRHAIHQIQRVEQKMRVNLKLQLLQLRLLRTNLLLIDLRRQILNMFNHVIEFGIDVIKV